MKQIVTLCMNPALDITTTTEVVRPTDKLRCTTARYDPGGGGINVANVAQVLGVPSTAVFPGGGPAGQLVHDLLVAEGIAVQRISIGGATRESFTVDETGTARQYRFVLPGPQLTVAEHTECLLRLRRTAVGAGIVVASGSLPPGVPDDFYQQVSTACEELGVPLLLDTSGEGLAHVKSGVFLLKPSIRELREDVGEPLAREEEQVDAARELITSGIAGNVLVSLGAQGALLVSAREAQRFAAVPVPPGSGVGAGDAMLAGVAVGISRGWPLAEAVRLGIAAGAAMLLTPGTAPCTREDTERLFGQTGHPVDVIQA
ncbi:MAG: 1-phosphofructokinase family hexose kinase [Mycobacteriaceae bacterium]